VADPQNPVQPQSGVNPLAQQTTTQTFPQAVPVPAQAAAQPAAVEPEQAFTASAAAPAAVAAAESKWQRWRTEGKALTSYLLDSEVHTFAFSVAANAILSFIPFIVLLYTLARSIFHSAAMVDVVNSMVMYFMPSNQQFVIAQLSAKAPRHGVEALSLIMILVACTGIFLPLEVALNQAWGVTKSRNYIMNQIVAFGLAILMVLLGFGCVFVNAMGRQMMTDIFFGHTDNFVYNGLSFVMLAATTAVASILFFFAIYWLMPNCKINPWPVMKTAVWTGLIWIGSKSIFEFILPHMDLESLYGPFQVSVGLIFWAYVSGLILFAGAQFSVGKLGSGKKTE
jgi:membrane protein